MASALANVRFTNEPSEATFRTQSQWAYDLEFSLVPTRVEGLIRSDLLPAPIVPASAAVVPPGKTP